MSALYMSENMDRPLVVLHSSDRCEPQVAEQLKAYDINLLVISKLDWDRDLSPWLAPGLEKKARPFPGGADEYLKHLTEEILPHARKYVLGKPAYTATVGYSLAGLFSLYALYKCDDFDRAACVSGSMWFRGFTDFVKTHEFMHPVQRIYISLGDREAKNRNPILKTVLSHTEAVAEHLRTVCDDVTFEMNPGFHFTDPPGRTMKGLIHIIGEKTPSDADNSGE